MWPTAGTEGKVEVREQYMTCSLQQHVLGLQVAIYEAQKMQIL
jgi:hypothetical protein